ncbi:MAG: PD-(D/E)XK nuclease family protein, partial [Bacteroidota bacterium]
MIYGSNQYGKDDSVKSKSLSIDKDFGLLSKVPSPEGYFEKPVTPAVVALHNFVLGKKHAAELKRLFYVAVTRAIHRLIITATHTDYKPRAGSFFELLSGVLPIGQEKNEIEIEGDVQFMIKTEKNYEFAHRKMKLPLKIYTELDEEEPAGVESKSLHAVKNFLVERISDLPKREIISATKISMFSQCPVKYELTYEIGFPPIFELIKSRQSHFEFNFKEDDDLPIRPSLKGKIIHAILCAEKKPGEWYEVAEKMLLDEQTIEQKDFARIIENIEADLGTFYASRIYEELKKAGEYRNEYEVYCEEENFFLFGIIDKLILNKERLEIIDYKTDDVDEYRLTERAESYFVQLKFYAYILSRLFEGVDRFYLRLVFIKHPDHPVHIQITRRDLEEFRTEIISVIKKIQTAGYQPNFNHCPKCQYALE